MISKLALGTVQFGIPYGISNKQGQVDINEASAILDFASMSGIATLDTAIAYGESEIVLGSLLNKKPDAFKIITKISANEDIRTQIESSLDKLQQDNLYGVLFHNTDDAFNNLKRIEHLENLKSKGVIEKVGYSLYNPDQLKKLFYLGVNVDIVQVPYNILDQRFKPYFAELNRREIEVHVRSVFLQGIFFVSPEDLDSKFDELKPHLRNIHQLSKESGLAINSIALGFAIIDEHIDQVVIGVESLKNLEENISSLYNLEKVKAIKDKLLNLECNKSRMILPTNWQ